MLKLLASAITNKLVVEFVYDNELRIVQPHALGLNDNFVGLVRGYQIGGGSSTKIPAWKLFKIDKMTDIVSLNDQRFSDPAPGYKPGDSAMSHIIAEL